jgi:hypothetical protein
VAEIASSSLLRSTVAFRLHFRSLKSLSKAKRIPSTFWNVRDDDLRKRMPMNCASKKKSPDLVKPASVADQEKKVQ